MTPHLADLLASATPFALPLATPFRGIAVREGVLLRGPSGFGEFTPFVEYDDTVCARWLTAAIEASWGHWPVARRATVEVNAIIPGVGPRRARELTQAAVRQSGCTVVKVKVGASSLADDCERVRAVAETLNALAPNAKIRVDANAAWSVSQAVTAIRELDRAAGGLEYVEQPAATLTELVEIRRLVDVPIAADESIRLAADAMQAARTAAVDLLVLKVAPLGGVAAALKIAEAVDIPVVVSGAMDSAVGLAAGLALAAALPAMPYACGLGTGGLLAADLVAEPLTPREGVLQVQRCDPDPLALAAATDRMTPQRKSWWLERLTRAYALL